MMTVLWDQNADTVLKGDNKRRVNPIQDRIYQDDQGFIHYVFTKKMFQNPDYNIPKEQLKLFKKFLDGGSRSYPSDGQIPLDIVATEVKIILNDLIDIANSPDHLYYEDAKKILECGKYSIVRGCVKLYLKKYTTRDWRRKRFTDDIDFWIFKINLFEYILKNNGWRRNPKSKEWEKQVEWMDYDSGQLESGILIASNDLNQRMDFGNCSYLDGASLKEIFKKKLKRGHDVDLSDIINVAMVQHKSTKNIKKEWLEAWEAIEESANTRESRIASNLISLCRYAYAIANYLEDVANVIGTHNKLIFDVQEYPNEKLRSLCRYSSHWMGYLINNGAKATRSMIYSYLIEQKNLKMKYAENLREFANSLIAMLNCKFKYANIIFEIAS